MTNEKDKIEIYCKNPKCFTHYLAKHKIKEKKETLSEKREVVYGYPDKLLAEDVKEKIQNAQKRLEEEILNQLDEKEREVIQKSDGVLVELNPIIKIINKIFKEEFGEKLLWKEMFK